MSDSSDSKAVPNTNTSTQRRNEPLATSAEHNGGRVSNAASRLSNVVPLLPLPGSSFDGELAAPHVDDQPITPARANRYPYWNGAVRDVNVGSFRSYPSGYGSLGAQSPYASFYGASRGGGAGAANDPSLSAASLSLSMPNDSLRESRFSFRVLRAPYEDPLVPPESRQSMPVMVGDMLMSTPSSPYFNTEAASHGAGNRVGSFRNDRTNAVDDLTKAIMNISNGPCVESSDTTSSVDETDAVGELRTSQSFRRFVDMNSSPQRAEPLNLAPNVHTDPNDDDQSVQQLEALLANRPIDLDHTARPHTNVNSNFNANVSSASILASAYPEDPKWKLTAAPREAALSLSVSAPHLGSSASGTADDSTMSNPAPPLKLRRAHHDSPLGPDYVRRSEAASEGAPQQSSGRRYSGGASMAHGKHQADVVVVTPPPALMCPFEEMQDLIEVNRLLVSDIHNVYGTIPVDQWELKRLVLVSVPRLIFFMEQLQYAVELHSEAMDGQRSPAPPDPNSETKNHVSTAESDGECSGPVKDASDIGATLSEEGTVDGSGEKVKSATAATQPRREGCGAPIAEESEKASPSDVLLLRKFQRNMDKCFRALSPHISELAALLEAERPAVKRRLLTNDWSRQAITAVIQLLENAITVSATTSPNSVATTTSVAITALTALGRKPSGAEAEAPVWTWADIVDWLADVPTQLSKWIEEYPDVIHAANAKLLEVSLRTVLISRRADAQTATAVAPSPMCTDDDDDDTVILTAAQRDECQISLIEKILTQLQSRQENHSTTGNAASSRAAAGEALVPPLPSWHDIRENFSVMQDRRCWIWWFDCLDRMMPLLSDDSCLLEARSRRMVNSAIANEPEGVLLARYFDAKRRQGSPRTDAEAEESAAFEEKEAKELKRAKRELEKKLAACRKNATQGFQCILRRMLVLASANNRFVKESMMPFENMMSYLYSQYESVRAAGLELENDQQTGERNINILQTFADTYGAVMPLSNSGNEQSRGKFPWTSPSSNEDEVRIASVGRSEELVNTSLPTRTLPDADNAPVALTSDDATHSNTASKRAYAAKKTQKCSPYPSFVTASKLKPLHSLQYCSSCDFCPCQPQFASNTMRMKLYTDVCESCASVALNLTAMTVNSATTLFGPALSAPIASVQPGDSGNPSTCPNSTHSNNLAVNSAINAPVVVGGSLPSPHISPKSGSIASQALAARTSGSNAVGGSSAGMKSKNAFVTTDTGSNSAYPKQQQQQQGSGSASPLDGGAIRRSPCHSGSFIKTSANVQWQSAPAAPSNRAIIRLIRGLQEEQQSLYRNTVVVDGIQKLFLD